MTILYKFLTRDEDIELTMKASKIMKHYGYEHQAVKLCEEAGEFIAAMARDYNDDTEESNGHAIEELADMILVLEQIINEVDARGGRKLAEIVMAKADRQLKRIEEEKHD